MAVQNLLMGDCMDLMKSKPDKYYQLAIVDVPYGIGESGKNMASRHHSQKKYAVKEWDNKAPDSEYFKELKRVSQNQIIWGANHFIDNLPFNCSSPCWIIWDKDRYGDFADGEIAWTSFRSALRIFKFTWDGFRKEEKCNRIHPTEKPIALYKYCLNNYAKSGEGKILDTHGGSFSHAIACYELGFDLDIIELDPEYYQKGKQRYDNYILKSQEINQY